MLAKHELNSIDNNPLASKAGMATAIKIAARIVSKWGASYEQAMNILRISRSVYAKALNGHLQEVKLDKDQLARASMIASIHASLRIIFTNPENIHGFMAMQNNNPFFDGRKPLEIIAQGDFIALYETFKQLDALRGGA